MHFYCVAIVSLLCNVFMYHLPIYLDANDQTVGRVNEQTNKRTKKRNNNPFCPQFQLKNGLRLQFHVVYWLQPNICTMEKKKKKVSASVSLASFECAIDVLLPISWAFSTEKRTRSKCLKGTLIQWCCRSCRCCHRYHHHYSYCYRCLDREISFNA